MKKAATREYLYETKFTQDRQRTKHGMFSLFKNRRRIHFWLFLAMKQTGKAPENQ
jgi:hypothetical protein